MIWWLQVVMNPSDYYVFRSKTMLERKDRMVSKDMRPLLDELCLRIEELEEKLR